MASGSLQAEGPSEETGLRKGWKEATTFLFNDAYGTFVDAKKKNDGPERELGEAVTLLSVQPRTRGNIEQAKAILERLADRKPVDKIAIHAKYWLARLLEDHASPSDPERAKTLYWELVSQHGGTRIAEAAAASRVFSDIYQPVSAEERDKRFQNLENWATYLKTSPGRRNYHLNMGFAYLEFAGDAKDPAAYRRKAVEHLKAADAEGITRTQVESQTWIAIGELAASLGDTNLAKEYYRKFLDKYRRDNRHYTIQTRLEALERNEGGNDAQ